MRLLRVLLRRKAPSPEPIPARLDPTGLGYDAIGMLDFECPEPPQGPGPGPAQRVEDDLADRLVRRFLSWADQPRNQRRALRLCLGVLGQGRSARAAFGLLNRVVFFPIVRASGTRPSAARMELVAAQLFALAMLRYRVRLEPVASMSVDELVPLYAPAIRAVLNAEPGERATGPAYRPGVVPGWDEFGLDAM
jgi:hypothetical protein